MDVSMIAIIGRNREVSVVSGVPWRLPRDKKHFRDYTAGQTLLLGRRTYEEMREWFTTQTPIVLTRDGDYPARHVVSTVDGALDLARRLRSRELVVVGGGGAYLAAMPVATRLVLTIVDDEKPDATIRFPQWNPAEWELEKESAHPPDSENPLAMRIVFMRRSSADGSRIRSVGPAC